MFYFIGILFLPIVVFGRTFQSNAPESKAIVRYFLADG